MALKRTSGVEQFGVDVEGFDELGEPVVVVSAKCYRDVNAWDFRVWIQDFVDHLDGHWRGRSVGYFILAVTHEINDDGMNEAARDLARQLVARGIKFRLWNTHGISQILRREVDLVDRYFNRYWVDAISATAGTSTPTASPATLGTSAGQAPSLSQQALAQATGLLSGPMGAALSASLEAALAAARSGRTGELRAWLDETRASPETWDALEPATKARSLAAVAMLHLRDGETAAAEGLLDEADRTTSPTDASPRALLLRATAGMEAALAALDAPSTSRERETRAALLVEAGRIDEAGAVLAEATGDAVTAEILRVRAIVALLEGRIRDAVADARSAIERAPGELAPLLTLATVRFYSALAQGVRPQVGPAPEPIQPGLLRGGEAARMALSAAADDFERAATSVEERLRPEIEVWRLAALLLNPARFEEGASYAASLLERPLPEPLAVAWAAQSGLVRRPGRVKRRYHVALRAGRATEAHLVVLALLCAGNEHPERGIAQIRRYEARFPRAAAFLEGWRAQFGDNGARGSDDFAMAVRVALETGNDAGVAESVLAPGTSSQAILSAAEFLTWRGSWRELDRLRAALAALATPRATELAALGAIRAGDPEGGLLVLDQGMRALGRDTLSRDLVHLRISANELLGRHEPVLADLMALRRDDEDAFAQARILDAYVRIGDLDRLRTEAERALDRGTLAPERALGVAHTLRATAPETARRLLTFATREATPPEMAAAIGALAADLSLADVREDMMRVLFTDPVAGRALTRFDRVEDALAFIDTLSREHRERFGEWLGGRMPFALVTSAEIETFGRMFLAEAPFRRDHLGDAFPMLLLSGGRRAPPPPFGGATTLRLDLSALLLASRLGMFPDLEERFRLQVPLGAAEALIELEASFHAPSAEVVSAVREVLDGRSAVCLVREVPAAALAAEEPGRPGEFNADVIGTLLHRAFLAGHLDRDRADGVASAMRVEGAPGADPGGGIVLTRAAVTRLAAATVLEQVARATPCYLPTGEADLMRRELADVTEEGRIRGRVAELRRMLAERLAGGAWTTVGLPPTEAVGEPVPAHVRCLQEVLSAHDRDAERLWIEDRALSHHRMDGVVHLPDLLDHMAGTGNAGPARRAEILREARRIGYAYLPLDPEPFLEALRSAPVREAALVETPALAGLRTWMARETVLLAHIDPNAVSRAAGDGRVVGEARRLLDAWGLLRDLLVRIWEEPDPPLDDRKARSAWVWTNLRIDRIVGQPCDATVEARRNFRILHLAFLLDAPLLAMLGGRAGTDTPWAEFVSWVMAACGGPLTEADPEARTAVLAIIAGQLRDILTMPADVPAEQERSLRASLAKLARDYVDLLPPGWSDELMGMPGIREGLGTTAAMVLTIGSEDEGGVRGEALLSEVSAAYGRVTDPSGAIGDGGRFRLLGGRTGTVEVAPGGAVLVIDGHRTGVDPVTLALLSPRSVERSIPPLERARLLDPLGTVTDDALVAVEAIEDVDARFVALERLLDGNLHGSLARKGERARSQGTLRLDDFALPAPAAVAAHLRITPEIDPDDVAATMVEAIANGFPPAEAMRRLAGLPFELPEDLRRSWAPEIPPRAGRAGGRISPLLAALELRALVSAGTDQDSLDAALAALLEAAGTQGAMFVAVARHLAAAAVRDPAWRDLDARVRLGLLWCHADQVIQHLCPSGHDFGEIAHWLEGHTAFPLAERIEETGTPDWYQALTVDLTEMRFKASLVAQAIREGFGRCASSAAVHAMMEACGTPGAEGWFPDLGLVAPRETGTSPPWPALDPLADEALGRWLGEGHPFSRRNDDALATVLVDGATGAETRHLVGPLLSLVDSRRVSGATAGRMRAALDAGQGTASFEPDSMAVRRILSVEAGLLARAGDEAGMHAVLGQEARRSAARWPGRKVEITSGGTGAPAALALLVEAALEFALRLDRPLPERFRAFAECIRHAVDAWPDCREAAAARLDAAVRLGDTETGGALWPVLLDLRGREPPDLRREQR
ncbi:hypothetical protein MKK88_14710 [Methylobacterium sp. E-005]|uniref:hypothetical protein n=1 Tax=Methylobacterium sp. E-005 TaxID=2836549 RepID=UPI001FBB2615|nr:hypothetical protein [Methylobacterium sp. E-005]MCJ2087226.1 hypothetical protein [Methylobacterium sp. E-005]